jgi:hypothetical protein
MSTTSQLNPACGDMGRRLCDRVLIFVLSASAPSVETVVDALNDGLEKVWSGSEVGRARDMTMLTFAICGNGYSVSDCLTVCVSHQEAEREIRTSGERSQNFQNGTHRFGSKQAQENVCQ